MSFSTRETNLFILNQILVVYLQSGLAAPDGKAAATDKATRGYFDQIKNSAVGKKTSEVGYAAYSSMYNGASFVAEKGKGFGSYIYNRLPSMRGSIQKPPQDKRPKDGKMKND